MTVSIIPAAEYVLEFSRASGPGGQNVNKTSSKVQLRWRVEDSAVFSPDQKNLIRHKLKNRLTNNDEILIVSEEERSQLQNRERVVARLNELIRAALHASKKRRATRPTRASRERRLGEKRERAERKQERKNIFD